MAFWPCRPNAAVIGCACAVALVACAATSPREPLPEPVVLSYPPAVGEAGRLDGVQALAEAVKGAYVRVLILEDSDPLYTVSGERVSGTVSGASGTVVDARGHIVTAAHIALGTRYRAEVTTVDGRVHRARILDVNPARELALLEVAPAARLRAPRFADSARLRAGEPVLAIGTPSNKKGVVSVGSIMRLRYPRRIQYGRYGYDNAIELRMWVQPGHSGGPVFNASGELIGIIGSFAVPNPGRAPLALAFAIPADAVAAYVAEVLGRRR